MVIKTNWALFRELHASLDQAKNSFCHGLSSFLVTAVPQGPQFFSVLRNAEIPCVDIPNFQIQKKKGLIFIATFKNLL